MATPAGVRPLAGKAALVTGAARGVGRATSEALAHAGANVFLVDVCRDLELCPYPLGSEAQLKTTRSRCEAHDVTAIAFAADVRSTAMANAAVATALTELGRIDVLVNNAGLVGPGGRLAHQLDDDEWQLVLDVNLGGVWRFSKAVLPHMVENRRGCILNIASTAGLVGFRSFASYVASKHGVVGLTKALAMDYGPFGIRVNAICPTSIEDDADLDSGMLTGVAAMLGVSRELYEDGSKAFHAMHTLVQAREVAATLLWLASDAASHITGAAIPVDAGFVAH